MGSVYNFWRLLAFYAGMCGAAWHFWGVGWACVTLAVISFFDLWSGDIRERQGAVSTETTGADYLEIVKKGKIPEDTLRAMEAEPPNGEPENN